MFKLSKLLLHYFITCFKDFAIKILQQKKHTGLRLADGQISITVEAAASLTPNHYI